MCYGDEGTLLRTKYIGLHLMAAIWMIRLIWLLIDIFNALNSTVIIIVIVIAIDLGFITLFEYYAIKYLHPAWTKRNMIMVNQQQDYTLIAQ